MRGISQTLLTHSTRLHLYILILTSAIFLVIGINTLSVLAESNGVSKDEIRIGQSCALQGPAKESGQGMRDGALAYFKHINNSGGIKGKKINLITYGDAGDPKRCIKNTSKLLDKDNVFLLFGFVGDPTSKAAVSIATSKKVPFFAPLTGAEFLRKPVNRYVFNLRASYFQETEAMVNRLISERSISRISIFYQKDTFGKAGLEGVRRALKKRGLEILNETHYEKGSLDVEPAVKALIATRPGAVILIGATEPCAKLIQQLRNAGSKAIFVCVSIVGAEALGKRTANHGLGVAIAQVAPFPYYRKIPIVAEYNQFLKQYMPKVDPSFVGMEGFIAAKALCKILLETPEPITREGFIKAGEDQFYTDLGGFSFSFSPENHQGADLVYFTQIGPGGFVTPIKKLTHLYDYADGKSNLFNTETP